MSLPKFSVDNHVLLNILLVTLISLGIISLARLPQEQFAEVPFYWVNVAVPYPGASAADIERSVTVPVEREMQGIDSLKQIQSVTSDGLSVVRVQFDDGITSEKFERLYQEVNTRFSRVTLPEGTLDAAIADFSSNDFLPVIEVVLSGSASRETLEESALRYRDAILELPGVSGANLAGSQARKILIAADRSKLDGVKLPLSDIVRAVQGKNISVPGGTVNTDTREYRLRTLGELSDTSDFGQVILRRSANGTVIHVDDVATVSQVFDDSAPTVRMDGEEAIRILVTKVPRGDASSIVAGVKRILANPALAPGEGIKVNLVNDSTVQIRDSISVLVINAAQGLVLLTMILLFFIGLRNALMTALGIPVTFAITFIILEAMGETLNSNTLFGLVLVLGMIVDHAIVLTENALRLRQKGMTSRDAAVAGTEEVMWPIVSSALTTMAAFLPLMLIPGTIGKFLRVIPLVVTVALGVSTVESILFIPSHLVHWPGGKKLPPSGDYFDRIRDPFKNALRVLYRHRALTVTAFFSFAVLIFSTLAFVKVDLFATEDYSLYNVDITMPPGSNRQETGRVVAAFEERLLPMIGNGEVQHVISTVGEGGSSTGEIVVDLSERSEGRKRSIQAILDEARWLTKDIPGADTVSFSKAQSGPPVSAPVGFRVRGDDFSSLEAAIEGIRERLATYPQIYNVEDTLESSAPELRIRINEERAVAYGLSVAAVGNFIRGIYDGYRAGSVFVNNQETDIVVRYALPADTPPLDYLMTLKIPTPSGSFVPFSAVCSVTGDDALAAIKRVDGKREASLSAEIDNKRAVPGINADIERWFKEEFAPSHPGTVLVTGGEFSEFADLLLQILQVFLLGIFLIYAILGAQFKSYTQPFLILLSIPMAFAGVMLFLAISGTPFSTTVLYAGVALAGIAVNDTIVLIDFINTDRKNGKSVEDAVLDAAATRLRPIALTSMTTIAGLLPTAIGIGGYSAVWSPMASTIIFGLLFSTLTAVTVVPSFYGLLFDRKKRIPAT